MARHPRLKALNAEDGAIYHLTTRSALQCFLFEKSDEKSPIVSILYRVAEFSGIEILNYCIMTNHFHLLVYVPNQRTITKREILRRYAILYGKDDAEALRRRWDRIHPAIVRSEQDAIRRRMNDITPFMQNLKQRITNAYHRANNGKTSGTLWQGRFHSTLVESGEALRAVAAYIDLNPVRAGMVDHPSQYPHCARGAAALGNSAANASISALENRTGDYSNLLQSDILRSRQQSIDSTEILGSTDFIILNLNPHLKAHGRRHPIPLPVPLHSSFSFCVPGTLRSPAVA